MVGMRNVVAITSAKVLKAIWHFSNSELSLSQVPIVKLIHQQCQIEADLSLYNVLARENTCLLSLYAGLTTLVLKLTKNVLDVWQPSQMETDYCSQILTHACVRWATWSNFLPR